MAKKATKKKAKKAPAKKNPVGRPTKYQKNFHPQDAIRLAKQGATIAMMCAEWEVARDRYYDWQQKHEEFRDAIKRVTEIRQAYWEKIFMRVSLGLPIQQNAHGKDANMTGLIFLMKNVAKWTDKAEIGGFNEEDEVTELIFD